MACFGRPFSLYMSKIVICPYNWFHQHEEFASGIAGGEIYLSRLVNHLRKNHEIRIIAGNKQPYIHDGIEIHPQGENIEIFTRNNEHFKWCDVVITQLIGTGYGFNKAKQHNKPLIFIAHNNSKMYAVRHCEPGSAHIIYNSYQLRDDLFSTFSQFNGTVLHPMLPPVSGRSTGNKITLINCNHNKGGHIFAEIASRLPQYEFMGIFGGYGDQIEAHLPNMDYLPNGIDMNTVYANTRILLVPSEFESFSQCAIEAMQYGIPVIAHPTQGIQENLSGSALYIDRNNITKYCETIVYLMENPQAWQWQSEVSYDRAANVSVKSAEELVRFDEWFKKIK